MAQKQLYSLDMAMLIAGTKFRGEFEQRMQELITYLHKQENIILFIDEIHTIMGAGATQGSLDVANILKPALARGTIQTIGATTPEEYSSSIERDAALDRRFQPVRIEPLSKENTRTIIEQLAPYYEQHHGIGYSQEAIEACLDLAERYITHRHFPDKAIDIMDEVGAWLRTDGELRSMRHRSIAQREDVERIVHLMTGIPVDRLSTAERLRLTTLEERLKQRVVGQQHAIATISQAILRSRAGLSEEHRPTGVFLLVGPSGVGKTLLAKELSIALCGTRESLVRIDMSEYGERHTVSQLIGSPPGYVGYGEGGALTEVLRRNPYAVVLFDEVEKAHPDIYNLMLQIFDEGQLTDAMGRKVDFRHSIIIMTSNAGSNGMADRRHVGYTAMTEGEISTSREEKYRHATERLFSTELLNRIDQVVVFKALSARELGIITKRECDLLAQRLQRQGIELCVDDAAIEHIATHDTNEKEGARGIKRRMAMLIEQPLAKMLVHGSITRGDRVTATMEGTELTMAIESQSNAA